MKICMRLAHIVIEISQFRFDDLLSICIKSVESKVQKNAFTSNGQNHPKGSPKGKLKESASHHVNEFIHETINFIIWVRFSRLSVTIGLMVEILHLCH